MEFIKKHKEKIYDIGFLVIVIGLIFSMRFFITPIVVSGHSMDNTLSSGMFGYALNTKENTKIERGDIVIVETEEHMIIKRVIGLPYETIGCIGGTVYVNGEAIEEKYVSSPTDDFDTIVLKENQYYVLGDNRQHSKDSRIIGPVEREDIKAKDIFVISFDKIGKVK